MVTPEETETIDSITAKSSKPVKKGSEFLTIGARVSTVAGVKNLYSKILINPYDASVDNHILVYRFVTDNDTTHEIYHDDYEHGAGRRLLQHTREKHIQNAAFLITRWMRDGHIGLRRFSIMENLVNKGKNLSG